MSRFDKFNELLEELAAFQESRPVMHKAMNGDTLLLRPDQARQQVELRANITKANTMLKALVDQGTLSALEVSKYQAQIHHLEERVL